MSKSNELESEESGGELAGVPLKGLLIANPASSKQKDAVKGIEQATRSAW